mmetsp:Transcript_10429/g.36409  ORF Transcript_10429/g.36409 Transcript_10429/m.36409 type:complete len:309 (-) Transcript_10429:65-991(-)
MRILRQKQHRKILRFYRMMYNVSPPFKVLLDGNFIHIGLRTSAEIKRLLPSLLQERPDVVRLFVTPCILNELRSLGAEFGDTLAEARTFRVARCGHGDDPVSAAECIASLIGTKNKEHFFVASQDGLLRSRLRAVAGTPIILLSQSVLVLEQPSDASKGLVEKNEIAKIEMSGAQRKALAALKRKHAEPAPATAAEVAAALAAAEGGDGAGGGAVGGAGGAPAPVKRKRRGPKEPNPLSMKKKKPKPEAKEKKSKTRRGKRSKKSGAGAGGAGGEEGGASGGADTAASAAAAARAPRHGDSSDSSDDE